MTRHFGNLAVQAAAVVWWALAAVLLAGACVVIAVPVLRHAGWTFARAEGTSMLPAISSGDLEIVRPARPAELRPGDIVAVQYGRTVVGHRLVSATIVGAPGDADPRWRLVTKGDALPSTDPPFPGEALVGRVVAVVPHAGALVVDGPPVRYAASVLLLVWYLGVVARLPVGVDRPGAPVREASS